MISTHPAATVNTISRASIVNSASSSTQTPTTVQTPANARSKASVKLSTEKRRGMDQDLIDIKLKHNGKLAWGTLYARPTSDKRQMQFVWKDSATVLFLSTIHSGRKQVLRNRKRPKNGSKLVQSTWKGASRKQLMIPDFINNYNHYINEVNLADQIRAAYSTQRRTRLTWVPLCHYLLDTTTVNAFLIWRTLNQQQSIKDTPQNGGLEFRRELSVSLLQYCRAKRPSRVREPKPAPSGNFTSCELVELLKREDCQACKAAGRFAVPRQKRKPLSQLSTNTANSETTTDKRRFRRTTKQCGMHGIPLCNLPDGICMQQHRLEYACA